MSNVIKKYRTRVLRRLTCFRKNKKKLEAKLDKSLKRFEEENADGAGDELIEAFGPPEEMARTLLNEVDETEKRQYKRLMKVLQIAGLVLMAAILVFAVYVFCLKEIPMNIVDDVDIEGTEIIPEWTGD